MTSDNAYLARLKAKVQQITSGGRTSLSAVKRKMDNPLAPGLDPEAPAFPRSTGAVAEAASLEAVIRWSRPVLWVRGDDVATDYSIAANHEMDKVLLQEMQDHQDAIEGIIPSVGRIELFNNMLFEWAGTGWIVDFDGDTDIVVTNAHVAENFATRGGNGFVFRPGIPDFEIEQRAVIDFREEIGSSLPREFPITEVIWISPDRRPDVAFLRVKRQAGNDRISPPVPLGTGLSKTNLLAVLGYPGKDDRVEYAEKLSQVFGESFGIKRLALGRLTGDNGQVITHDCSTLPGNSGSLIWDCQSGTAVGLHYAGTAFSNNFAVPARTLRELIRLRPWQGLGEQPRAQGAVQTSPPAGGSAGEPKPSGSTDARVNSDGSVSLTVPLNIRLSLGDGIASVTGAGAADTAATVRKTDRASAEAVAGTIRNLALASANSASVLEVGAEYLFREGELTDEVGIVVAVAPGASLNHASYGLSESYDGVPVVLEYADPQVIAEEMFGFQVETEAFRARRAGYDRDLNDPRFDLSPVTGKIRMRLCVSPEAGWPVLREFLGIDDYEQLTIGMYHVTAPHIVEALKAIAGRSRPNPRITLTLDRQRGDKPVNPDDISDGTKKDDIPERDTIKALEQALGSKFLFAKASLGSGGLFATAYHIKVAVWTDRLPGSKKADKIFWLSSGNWQSSNQQPLTIGIDEIPGLRFETVAEYNREYHAVVEHAGLAATFREHLEQDQVDNAQASALEAGRRQLDDEILVPAEMLERPRRPVAYRPFSPLDLDEDMTVHPLLTPDNYPEAVLDLVNEATTRLWICNQSFNLWKNPDDTPEHFLAIARAVRERQRAGVDVRILFRNIFGSERKTMRRLKAFGLRTDEGHMRFFPKNHTKGMVVDDHAVMLGSHNLTGGGTGPNRDASLIIRNARANAYFAEIFLHDWTQYGDHRPAPDRESVRPVKISRAGARVEAPQGYVALSLGEFLGEG
jgi:hypothetical protein